MAVDEGTPLLTAGDQTKSSAGRRRRQPWLPVGVAVLGAADLAFFQAIGRGGAACAAPPPGYHWQPQPLSVYLQVFGPPLLVLFVGGYFALGARTRFGRVVASALVLSVAVLVSTFTALYAPYCESLFPPS